MKEGRGFARRVTLKNLAKFSPLLGKTTVPTESASSQRTPDKSISKRDAARYREADSLFRGKPLRLRVPFEKPPMRPGRRQAGQFSRMGTKKAGGSVPGLIAEIPGPSRWKQANFDLDNFVHFFQCDPKQRRELTLGHVERDGTVTVEHHPSVAVKSSNFRVELGAASGLRYPPKGAGRPIGVFIRTGTRKFVYRLLMPSDPDYAIVNEFLARNATSPQNQMRRLRISLANLKQFWPKSPLWKTLRNQRP